jgi:hypothetical protein
VSVVDAGQHCFHQLDRRCLARAQAFGELDQRQRQQLVHTHLRDRQ